MLMNDDESVYGGYEDGYDENENGNGYDESENGNGYDENGNGWLNGWLNERGVENDREWNDAEEISCLLTSYMGQLF